MMWYDLCIKSAACVTYITRYIQCIVFSRSIYTVYSLPKRVERLCNYDLILDRAFKKSSEGL